MRLVIFNGSPRGLKSNSLTIMKHFQEGIQSSSSENEAETVNLIEYQKDYSPIHERLIKADNALFAFPLYVDSMPGFVMGFFESLLVLKDSLKGKIFLFSIQCGFPETINLRAVEKLLERLPGKLGATYGGCICRGGMEGARYMPEDYPAFQKYRELGKIYAETGKLDPEILVELAKPERIPKPMMLIARMLNFTGIFNGYWNRQLKANNAYDKRFAKPYKP
jgi:multimeric flavodoxin WrbA